DAGGGAAARPRFQPADGVDERHGRHRPGRRFALALGEPARGARPVLVLPRRDVPQRRLRPRDRRARTALAPDPVRRRGGEHGVRAGLRPAARRCGDAADGGLRLRRAVRVGGAGRAGARRRRDRIQLEPQGQPAEPALDGGLPAPRLRFGGAGGRGRAAGAAARGRRGFVVLSDRPHLHRQTGNIGADRQSLAAAVPGRAARLRRLARGRADALAGAARARRLDRGGARPAAAAATRRHTARRGVLDRRHRAARRDVLGDRRLAGGGAARPRLLRRDPDPATVGQRHV
ncbi:MAG: Aromatic prenyltransferase 1, UbiA family, partial [uncultured Acetobacteraceae bacterium]